MKIITISKALDTLINFDSSNEKKKKSNGKRYVCAVCLKAMCNAIFLKHTYVSLTSATKSELKWAYCRRERVKNKLMAFWANSKLKFKSSWAYMKLIALSFEFKALKYKFFVAYFSDETWIIFLNFFYFQPKLITALLACQSINCTWLY